MPIHANSVISTQIQLFNAALYISITDKENYCYTTTNVNIISGSEITTYQSKFQALSDAIVAYLATNRNAMVTDAISNFIGYHMMHSLYGTDYTQFPNLAADVVFTINAQSSTIITAPLTQYSDYNGVTFNNLDATISAIGLANAAEQLSLVDTLGLMTTVVKAQTLMLMMNDIVPIGSAPFKHDIGNTVFGSLPTQLKFKQFNTILNFNLAVPPYVA